MGAVHAILRAMGFGRTAQEEKQEALKGLPPRDPATVTRRVLVTRNRLATNQLLRAEIAALEARMLRQRAPRTRGEHTHGLAR